MPYAYTYTYIVTKQYIDTVSSETNDFVSYNVIKYIDEEHIGYTYGTYTYGFYLIDTHFDNTRGSFNLIGVDNLTKKSFTYINENYIYDEQYNIIDMYKLLLPSLKSNPFNILQQNNNIINIEKNSDLFHYLETISEEVHRFAITFFKDTQTKNTFNSILDEIDGIGKRRKILDNK